MQPRTPIAAVGALGALAVVLGVVQPAWVPFLRGAPWLAVAGGVVYAASAAAAWTLLETDRESVAVALAPAVLAPVVTLLAYAGVDVVAGLAGNPVLLSTLAVVFGVGLSFPLAVARRPRRQWALVGALLLAAVPVVATALSALSPGPPEDRDLLVLGGMIALQAATLLAVPTYALGRSVRRRLPDVERSPYPTLVAAALPFVLVLAGFVPAPYFARETIYGPWLVVVPAVALLAVAVQFVRISRSPGGS